MNELVQAVSALPNQKVPGRFCLPLKFYKAFLPKIKDLVLDSITYAVQHKGMSTDQWHGIVTLIPKKNKDTIR